MDDLETVYNLERDPRSSDVNPTRVTVSVWNQDFSKPTGDL